MSPISKDKIFSLDVLIYNMVMELDKNKKDIIQSERPGDIISKIIDSHVPFENYKLAGLLIDDLSLGYPYRKFEQKTDVFELLKWSIYERLNIAADRWHRQHLDNKSYGPRRPSYVRSYN